MKATTLQYLYYRLETLELEYKKRGRDLKDNINRYMGTSGFERNTINELLIMQGINAEMSRLRDTIDLLKALEKTV